MSRLTALHQIYKILALSGNRVAVTLALASICFTSSAFAVTQQQLNSVQSQIQSLNQNIRTSDTRISTLESDIRIYERQILETRKQLREERLAGRKQLFDVRREMKLQDIEIDRIEKDIALVNTNIDVVNRDSLRDQDRFASLNVVKQGLESGEFKNRQADYERQLATHNERKAALMTELNKARQNKARLQEQVDSVENDVDDSALDRDPRLGTLLQKRDYASNELLNLRTRNRNDRARLILQQEEFNRLSNQFKREQQPKPVVVAKPAPAPVTTTPAPRFAPATAATSKVTLDRTNYGAWVFVISGDQAPDIEQTLHLKNWVESYDAKYIQLNASRFKDFFRSYLQQIPKNARIILIGHGLGAGAAIEAATGIAFAESRTIDFLAALDPIGERNLRANIVYNTEGACQRPQDDDELSNSDYIECIKTAHKRLITGNIKYFYNRWQKDAQGPLDYQREIRSLDRNGKVVQVPTATGRFEIAENTDADQKRLFFAGNSNAHQLLLAEEARQLPKLLVQYLR